MLKIVSSMKKTISLLIFQTDDYSIKTPTLVSTRSTLFFLHHYLHLEENPEFYSHPPRLNFYFFLSKQRGGGSFIALTHRERTWDEMTKGYGGAGKYMYIPSALAKLQ
jgi:hypothetical protein